MIGVRTNACVRTPPPLSDNAARLRRERAADEARWEAQLRTMARDRPRERAPAAVGMPPPVTKLLDLVNGRSRHDTLLIPRTLPVITGSEPENLACGKCGTVIAARISPQSARRQHPEGDRLVVRCTCRALNLLCGMAGIRSSYVARRNPPVLQTASA